MKTGVFILSLLLILLPVAPWLPQSLSAQDNPTTSGVSSLSNRSELEQNAASILQAEDSPESSTNSGGRLKLEGQELPLEEKDLLLEELNREHYQASRARRFEIVFFVSLPVTLWLTYTLMEFMAGKHAGPDNLRGELQSPHYIFMLSTSLLTSFYIAYEDMQSVRPYRQKSVASVAEWRFEMPIVGVQF